jgi:hypothetical protein
MAILAEALALLFYLSLVRVSAYRLPIQRVAIGATETRQQHGYKNQNQATLLHNAIDETSGTPVHVIVACQSSFSRD